MSFLSKLFKKNSSNNPSSSEGYAFGISKLDEIEELAQQGKYEEAVAIIDLVLDLPKDNNKAVQYLKEKMKYTNPAYIKNITGDPGSLNGYNIAFKGELMIGGGLTHELIRNRGIYIINSIDNLLKTKRLVVLTNGKDLKYVGNPPGKIKNIINKAQQQIILSLNLFINDTDILGVAGAIAIQLGNINEAESMLKLALNLDPQNTKALNSLNLIKEHR
ncbi:MAG TPA: hypothetical protein VGK00_01685 [Anaerolineales bacterium]|jgi:tetratricopeptide (TPR) repeat protein